MLGGEWKGFSGELVPTGSIKHHLPLFWTISLSMSCFCMTCQYRNVTHTAPSPGGDDLLQHAHSSKTHKKICWRWTPVYAYCFFPQRKSTEINKGMDKESGIDINKIHQFPSLVNILVQKGRCAVAHEKAVFFYYDKLKFFQFGAGFKKLHNFSMTTIHQCPSTVLRAHTNDQEVGNQLEHFLLATYRHNTV